MNVLFVCTGNLNRSPIAEALLKKFLKQDKRTDVSVQSAGTHAMGGSPAPTEAIEVANQAGIDLSAHSAKPISRELVDWAEKIVVMSPEHADFIEINYSDAVEKIDEMAVYRIGGKPGDSMPDPYGLSIFHYRQYFAGIMEAVQGFYSKIKNGSLG